MTEPDDARLWPTPTEPGFYWRRAFRFGDSGVFGWAWVPAEVYRPYGSSPDAPLMTNGYSVDGVHWGPRLVPPSDD